MSYRIPIISLSSHYWLSVRFTKKHFQYCMIFSYLQLLMNSYHWLTLTFLVLFHVKLCFHDHHVGWFTFSCSLCVTRTHWIFLCLSLSHILLLSWTYTLHYPSLPSPPFCLSLAPGTILNIHNCPLMSMLNGCQDDLATWQNWIVFDKPRLEPEQGSKEEKGDREKRDIDPRGVFGYYVEPIRTLEQGRWRKA